jgi:hypothetical protein
MKSKVMAQILVEEAEVWGIKLERRCPDQLIISPASKCPVEFKSMLREHKREILDLLEAQADGLAPDCAPWLHTAKQVLDGEFDGADSSTRESLIIGLRSIDHPVCRDALARVRALADKEDRRV